MSPTSARVGSLATVAWTVAAAWAVTAERAVVADSVIAVSGIRLTVFRVFCHVIEAIHPREGLPGAPGASAPVVKASGRRLRLSAVHISHRPVGAGVRPLAGPSRDPAAGLERGDFRRGPDDGVLHLRRQARRVALAPLVRKPHVAPALRCAEARPCALEGGRNQEVHRDHVVLSAIVFPAVLKGLCGLNDDLAAEGELHHPFPREIAPPPCVEAFHRHYVRAATLCGRAAAAVRFRLLGRRIALWRQPGRNRGPARTDLQLILVGDAHVHAARTIFYSDDDVLHHGCVVHLRAGVGQGRLRAVRRLLPRAQQQQHGRRGPHRGFVSHDLAHEALHFEVVAAVALVLRHLQNSVQPPARHGQIELRDFKEHVFNARPDCVECAEHVGADEHCCARAFGTKRQSRVGSTVRAVGLLPRGARRHAITASRTSCTRVTGRGGATGMTEQLGGTAAAAPVFGGSLPEVPSARCSSSVVGTASSKVVGVSGNSIVARWSVSAWSASSVQWHGARSSSFSRAAALGARSIGRHQSSTRPETSAQLLAHSGVPRLVGATKPPGIPTPARQCCPVVRLTPFTFTSTAPRAFSQPDASIAPAVGGHAAAVLAQLLGSANSDARESPYHGTLCRHLDLLQLPSPGRAAEAGRGLCRPRPHPGHLHHA
eukprot:scaffold99745_cov66-Phaeocystis_antarctica.AAC.7